MPVGIDNKYNYNISVSKFCCPVCWELIRVLNETNKEVKFVVRARHSHLYPVHLPPWLPDSVMEKMIECFGRQLYEKFCQLPIGTDSDLDEPLPFVLGHRRKNPSMESAGESVSSCGSTDMCATRKDV